MPEVVKGLKDKPPLLFGIGAGVILVVVLGATADVWLVLIVAGVLVLALGAWLVNDAQRLRNEAVAHAPADKDIDIRSARIKTGENVKVGLVEGAGAGSVKEYIDVTDAEIGAGSTIGGVRESRAPEPEPRE